MMSDQELWQWVHYSYGEDLGLPSDDDDYITLSAEDKVQFQKELQMEEKMAQQYSDTSLISETTGSKVQNKILRMRSMMLTTSGCNRKRHIVVTYLVTILLMLFVRNVSCFGSGATDKVDQFYIIVQNSR